MHIVVVNTLVSFFSSIVELVGKKAYLWLLINVILGALEGLGLAIIIPLLFALKPDSASNNVWIEYMKSFFELIHIDYSIPRVFILVVCVFLLSRLFVLFSYWFDAFLFKSTQATIYRKALKNYERMSYPFYIESNSGHFNNLLHNESTRAIAAIQSYTKSVNCLIMTIVFFLFSMINNYSFTLTIMVSCGVVFILLTKSFSITKKLSYQLSSESSLFQSVSIQFFNNFKYLISTNSFPSYIKHLWKGSADVTLSRYKMKLLSDRISVITVMAVFPILVFIFYYFVTTLEFPVDGLLISMGLTYRALSKALNFQSSWQRFNNFIGSYKYFSKSIKEITENAEVVGSKVVPAESFEIEITSLEFSYGEDFSIDVPNMYFGRNKIYSLVGGSGSGKTTILDLISGIFVPEKGNLKVNGLNYKEVNIRKMREQIGLVNQESSLFDDSIFNNVSGWSEYNEENLKNVERVCKLANIDVAIEALDNKYDTLIGDSGLKLSGGQRQRLTIARELYKKPSVLLLDEATSALDSESELKIKETIESLRGQMTIIIVAHRLSTVRKSDVIYVMEKGRVLEQGSFDELMNLEKSRFKDLVQHQLIKE